MLQFPHAARQSAESEAGNPEEKPGDCYERKEVPESANECAALELRAEVTPGERRRADEAEKERTVRRDVLDCGASQLIELGLNSSSRDAARDV